MTVALFCCTYKGRFSFSNDEYCFPVRWLCSVIFIV